MLQGMILRQLEDPAPAVPDKFSGDNEPLPANRRGSGTGLGLAEHVAREQEKLIVRQQPQLQIRCVHMEVLSRDVTDAQICLGLLNMVLHVGPLVVEPADVLFVPIEVGHEGSIGIAQGVEKVGLSPFGLFWPSNDNDSTRAGPAGRVPAKGANLYRTGLGLPPSVCGPRKGQKQSPKGTGHPHLDHVPNCLLLQPPEDFLCGVAPIHPDQDFAQSAFAVPMEPAGQDLPALFQEADEIGGTRTVAWLKPRPEGKTAAPLPARLHLIGEAAWASWISCLKGMPTKSAQVQTIPSVNALLAALRCSPLDAGLTCTPQCDAGTAVYGCLGNQV